MGKKEYKKSFVIYEVGNILLFENKSFLETKCENHKI